MPTYEYQCDACQHSFDEFQSMTEPPLKKCPKCGKKKLQRLFGTGAAVLFKGAGFYETDYRSDNYKAAAKAEADKVKPAESGAKDAGTNGKTDTSSPGDGGSKAKNKGKSAKAGG
jgi:putative FmdB family regulatory protein